MRSDGMLGPARPALFHDRCDGCCALGTLICSAIQLPLGFIEDHCNTVGTLEYFPFISKMTVAIELPIPLPFPLSVRAFLDSNLRLAALTKVVRDYCDGFSHSPSAHFNCHFTFLNAQGFTFVDIGVEILLGIKIPLLGTIGDRLGATFFWLFCVTHEQHEARVVL